MTSLVCVGGVYCVSMQVIFKAFWDLTLREVRFDMAVANFKCSNPGFPNLEVRTPRGSQGLKKGVALEKEYKQ